MRKSAWRQYLTQEGKRLFDKLDNKQKAQIMFKVNKRAVQCLEDLTLIFEEMHRITGNPDKQFAKIFYKDDILPRFWEHFTLSKNLAYDYKAKGLSPYSLSKLMAKLTLAQIPYDTKRLIEDKNYRLAKISEIE